MKKVSLSPSVLTADFARLGDEVSSVEPHVDRFHLDVMDGHYVPNLTFGPDVVAAIARHTSRPLHVHLMLQEPLRYAERFVEAGATWISFHPEVVDDVPKAIEGLREVGAKVGLAVHPDVALPVVADYLGAVDLILMMTVRPGFGGQKFLEEVVPKIADVRRAVDRDGLQAEIEVDGGVNLGTIDRVVGAGVDVVVAGSAIFDGVDAPAAARRLRSRLEDARREGEGPPDG